ncbi:MAG: histidinol dehydrogenase [Clostridiales bacterium]|jgi:histidinol dehydrogenase|nr:histidinol dehydrogenase [Clostridiales bacterium]
MLRIQNSYEKKLERESYDKELAAVDEILRNVRVRGDAALFEYTKKFDGTELTSATVKVSESEIAEAYERVDGALLEALGRAKTNILKYHERQRPTDAFDGKTGWKFVPVKRAGLYVPGGLGAYPSSVLMSALPAVAAGVDNIVMVTPNLKNPLILAAAKLCGVNRIYRIGGAQAIAALAYGTQSVEKVDMIAGPGNIYVTLAKKRVFGEVGIDMLAGPSEVAVLADAMANPKLVIADLLAQAEHGPNGASILVTTDSGLAAAVAGGLDHAIENSARREILKDAIERHCQIIAVKTMKQAIKIINDIASEHLEICTANAYEISRSVYNAGAIFIGHDTPVAAGDYYAGPSHVLPTGGTGRFSSVLSTDTFLKRISLIGYNKAELSAAGSDIVRLAETEGFEAHANSVKLRIESRKLKIADVILSEREESQAISPNHISYNPNFSTFHFSF